MRMKSVVSMHVNVFKHRLIPRSLIDFSSTQSQRKEERSLLLLDKWALDVSIAGIVKQSSSSKAPHTSLAPSAASITQR